MDVSKRQIFSGVLVLLLEGGCKHISAQDLCIHQNILHQNILHTINYWIVSPEPSTTQNKLKGRKFKDKELILSMGVCGNEEMELWELVDNWG